MRVKSKITRRSLLPIMLGMLFTIAQGQTLERKVFSTAGLTASPTGAYFSTTIGEAVMGTRLNALPYLVQGFQQPIILRPLAAISSELYGYWQKNKVALTWYTDMPAVDGHFIVERKFEGGNFQAIKMVPTSGTSDYSFVDQDQTLISQKKIFYRINHVQLNGAYLHSNTIEITPSAQLNITVFPNPVKTSFKVIGVADFPCELQMMNTLGQVVYAKQYDSPNQITVNSRHLARGNYVLKIITADTYISSRIILR